MEYDSASNSQARRQDSEAAEKLPRSVVQNSRAERDGSAIAAPKWIPEKSLAARAHASVGSDRSLSAQVMEYYHKYSQNSGLGRYFSQPESSLHVETDSYHRRAFESLSDTAASIQRHSFLAPEDRSITDSSTPRERRRWARPPLIGQPSGSDNAVASTYVGTTIADSRTPSPICKRPTTETIPEERDESSRENLGQAKDSDGKVISPTSSVASHKPLEWDSGADVGYYNALPPTVDKDKKLCTIERMALARGCSAALRLDPEGTNESTASTSNPTDCRRRSMKPDANSTPLTGMRGHGESGESESEIEITPIVKNHSPGVIAERPEVDNDGAYSRNDLTPKSTNDSRKPQPSAVQTIKSTAKDAESSGMKKSASMNLLVFPLSRLSLKRSQSELNLRAKDKKIVQPLPPIVFDSTSSIATVVDKPATCDKFIQTSLDTRDRESIGIQVSSMETSEDANDEPNRGYQRNPTSENDDEKPPLPKRASSLTSKCLHSILKNSSDTYKIRDGNFLPRSGKSINETSKKTSDAIDKNEKIQNNDETIVESSTNSSTRRKIDDRERINSIENAITSDASNRSKNESSRSDRVTTDEDATAENATDRATDSFEYFPGHVYQNVRNCGTSQVSSIDTGRESRCSTMPNTSSSLDEKLWGDSDSLVRDLERSVNILKSLVDANKCDKQVKKRLIHHVIKRLVTAKYGDDVIDRDLDENVPWNPADARNKVYRNEIIQALVNKQNTTDSSNDDWLPIKRNIVRGNVASPKKIQVKTKDSRSTKEFVDYATIVDPGTPNSDEFPFDRHTDVTATDGRKARMGLRSDDRRRERSNVDRDPSESSECFLPQSRIVKKTIYGNKNTKVYYTMNDVGSNEKNRRADSPISRENGDVDGITSTDTGTSSKIMERRRNNVNEEIVIVKERRGNCHDSNDWKLPTTMSERRFEMERFTNSESGDAKLINYAEMEKRNQLVWITNEISHLCNLKRLLQESNKSGDRQTAGDSERKRSDGWTIGQRSCGREKNLRSGEYDSDLPLNDDKSVGKNVIVEKSFDNPEQWSSHGNLTVGQSANDYQRTNRKDRYDDRHKFRSVRNAKKMRNSCTQTGSDDDPTGHSKTGGEIISSTIPIQPSTISTTTDRTFIDHGTRDACVQTISTTTKKSSIVATGKNSKSSNRLSRICSDDDEKIGIEEKSKHVCHCQRYAIHSRHSACVMDSARRCAGDRAKRCSHRSRDDGPITIATAASKIVSTSPRMGSNSRVNDSRKEAKNQLNADCKSKYEIRELPIVAKNRCADCDIRDSRDSPEFRDVGDEESVTSSTGRSDEIEIGEIAKIRSRNVECDCEIARSRRSDDEKRDGNDDRPSRSCEIGSQNEEATCRCEERSTRVRRDRRNDENRSQIGNDTAIRKKMVSRLNEKNSTDDTRKCCRTCGTNWYVRDGKNVDRRCSCVQDYLKPVAYELKFEETIGGMGMKEGTRKNDRIVGKTSIASEIVQTKVDESMPNSVRSRGKCACDDDDEKEDVDNEENHDRRPGTLKDFLATNRPQFLENVETRRQYMSEISQLRQFKRERRKQFFAMAGNSAFAKPQKPAKGPTTGGQRKVSEYDMKLRLRMRYLRLNEVRSKRRQREKEEEARRNHLMAKLFGQKLQEKVLKGQVDLSQSVSVISNI